MQELLESPLWVDNDLITWLPYWASAAVGQFAFGVLVRRFWKVSPCQPVAVRTCFDQWQFAMVMKISCAGFPWDDLIHADMWQCVSVIFWLHLVASHTEGMFTGSFMFRKILATRRWIVTSLAYEFMGDFLGHFGCIWYNQKIPKPSTRQVFFPKISRCIIMLSFSARN